MLIMFFLFILKYCSVSISRYPAGNRPAFACWPPLRNRQKHISFVHFQTFFVDFSREITAKSLIWTKKVEKSSLTSFWVSAATKTGWNTQQWLPFQKERDILKYTRERKKREREKKIKCFLKKIEKWKE